MMGVLGGFGRRFSSFAIPGLIPVLVIAVILASQATFGTASWSRKYQVSCQTCHSVLFARLNLDGERFLWNGYQDPDSEEPDGDVAGKKQIGERLALDNDVGNWFQARLSVTPFQAVTNAATVDGEKETQYTIGNTNWLQLFVAGSIAKNISIYIENEVTSSNMHFAWYYMGFHNLFGTSLLNFHVGRVSPTVLNPYPDRLPQLPPIGGGIMRVQTSAGKGESPVDIRSARHGIQYYGYTGPALMYAGVSPGTRTSTPGGIEKIGYWGGLRALVPAMEGGMSMLEGSSIGIHYMGGTATANSERKMVENDYYRIMPSANLRVMDMVDLQGAYVYGNESNWALDSTRQVDLTLQGVRFVGSVILGESWAVSAHYDNYWTDDQKLLADENRLYFPVVTYLPRENIRLSVYPGYDLRDVPDDQVRHELLTNIRVAF